MKQKEGRDYLEFENCVVSVSDDKIKISNMAETINLSVDEFKRLVKFFVDHQIKERK